tara:strand:- start:819 stop:1112 length:294 start_codon:yes stop_codon:yes gene_type:complete
MKLTLQYLKQFTITSIVFTQAISLIILGFVWWFSGSAAAVNYIKTQYVGDYMNQEGLVLWLTVFALLGSLFCAPLAAFFHWRSDLAPIPTHKKKVRG